MNALRGLLAITLLALLAGCVQQPLRPVDDWDTHRRAAAELNQWNLSGKVGARLPENSGSARLHWRQEQDQFRIDLSGPFGQGRVIIDSHNEGVRLRQGGEPPLEAPTAEELMWHATGWAFPVEQLMYWVRGIPAPDYAHHIGEYTPEGLLKTMTQSGWTLNFSDYEATEAVPLPGRIIATRDDTRLILVVHEWSLQP